jgi:ABC transport system ATP-binding/permease protein
MATNLVNLERVDKAYGVRPLLAGVSLGVAEGERIGVVGRNGDGKTTLLRLLARTEQPDAGRITHASGLRVGMLAQQDALVGATVADAVLPGRSVDEAVRDRRVRDVLAGLLADVPLDRSMSGLSGGELRRVSLARVLVGEHDLLLLDEPTNHLDIEVTDWLARTLVARPEALVVVTHDRWFLDAVCTQTWEVEGGEVSSYEGGYAAYVLAKAERMRLADTVESRRQNLLRKELAWLRRGAPARTSKPKFRLDAASALIEDEPPPRDSVGLAKFATTRLGKTVLDLEDVDIVRGPRTLLSRLTWQLGPGERIGLVGVNGSGKTSLLRVLSGDDPPSAGRLVTGRTVSLAHLSQSLEGLDLSDRVQASVEDIRRVIKLAPTNVRPGAVGRRPVPTSGPEVSAVSLLERFGFRGDALSARIGDLSGGERRRLQLLRLLIAEPNVLLLDEPTNDLDIDTLQVIEDYLDAWPGSLVVVSHDRYFLERVCDTVLALMGDGSLAMLPGGVEEYLARRRSEPAPAGATPSAAPPSASDAAELRAAKKELARLERQLSKLTAREEQLHADLAAHASDYEKLMKLDEELRLVVAEREELETRWLELADAVE